MTGVQTCALPISHHTETLPSAEGRGLWPTALQHPGQLLLPRHGSCLPTQAIQTAQELGAGWHSALLVQPHLHTSQGERYIPFKRQLTGFPGGAVVENLPANAGDTGSSPGLGRSHMPRSSWAREPQLLSLRVWSLCPATGGAAIVKGPRTAMKSGPHLPQLEKALVRTEDPAQPKINK